MLTQALGTTHEEPLAIPKRDRHKTLPRLVLSRAVAGRATRGGASRRCSPCRAGHCFRPAHGPTRGQIVHQPAAFAHERKGVHAPQNISRGRVAAAAFTSIQPHRPKSLLRIMSSSGVRAANMHHDVLVGLLAERGRLGEAQCRTRCDGLWEYRHVGQGVIEAVPAEIVGARPINYLTVRHYAPGR